MRDSAGKTWHSASEAGRQVAAGLSQQWERMDWQSPRRLARGLGWLSGRFELALIRTPTRAHLDDYWRQTLSKLRRGLVFRINPWRLGLNLLRDLRLCLLFNLSFLLGYGK